MDRFKAKIRRGLRWSERYTKTDMVYLARGGFWLTLGQIVSSLSSFILAIAFANLLPKETYGIYRYILSIVGILAISTLPGINTALARAVARGDEGALLPALKVRIKWGVLGGLAALLIAGYYYLNGNTVLALSFSLAAIFLPFLDSLTIYISFLHGRKRFDLMTLYSVITSIVSTAVLVGILFLTDSVFLILLTYFAVFLVLRFIFFGLTGRRADQTEKVDRPTISFGRHLSLMTAVSALATYIDKVLIFHYLGPVELAIYSFALAPVEQGKALLKNLHTLALPRFAQRTREEVRSTFFHKLWRVSLTLVPFVALYIVLAPFLFGFFFPQYPESVKFSQVLALVVLEYAGASLQGAYFSAQRIIKEFHITTLFSGVSRIILMFVLVIPYGIWGVVIGTLVSRFISVGLGFYLIKRGRAQS